MRVPTGPEPKTAPGGFELGHPKDRRADRARSPRPHSGVHLPDARLAEGVRFIAKDEGGGVVTNYDYDPFGQLRSVDLPDGTLVEYGYDGVGRRIGRVVDGVRDRIWVYGGGLGPIAELDSAGNIVQRYVSARWPHVPDAIVETSKKKRGIAIACIAIVQHGVRAGAVAA
jgi:YD repeat-containing protein